MPSGRITYSLLGKQGALGNQLWEIAGTYGVAQDALRTPGFPEWFYQPYFSVPAPFFGYPKGPLDIGEDYMQDMAYFHPKYERDIRAFFSPSALSRQILYDFYGHTDLSMYTAVHVRRGNNLTAQYSSHHPSPSLDYFEHAISLLMGPLLVFTDDEAWCRKQSIFRNATYALGPPDNVDVMDLTKYAPVGTQEAAIDLLAIAKCGQHVISNSSFSWWGAYLAHETDRRTMRHPFSVIYPKQWYGPALAHINTDVMFTHLDAWYAI